LAACGTGAGRRKRERGREGERKGMGVLVPWVVWSQNPNGGLGCTIL